MKPSKERGDLVSFEYRDKYDRETGTGVIVEVEYNRYKIALVELEKGKWYWTNYWSWESENRIKPLLDKDEKQRKVESLGLNL